MVHVHEVTYVLIRRALFVIEGSLKVKLPTIWIREKQRWEESEKRREEERRKKKEERKKKKEERRKKIKKQKKTKNQKNKNKKSKNQKSKNQKKQVSGERRSSVQKGRKSRNTVFFPMICGSGGSTSRLAQAAGAEPAGQMRVENCTRLWRQAHFQVKMYKTPQLRSTFRSCDVGKVHAVVARSTFRSQSVKNTRGSDHCWTFGCRFAWQAQGIVHLVKNEQNVRVL